MGLFLWLFPKKLLHLFLCSAIIYIIENICGEEL